MRKSNLVKAMACFMAATMAVTCVPSVNMANNLTAVVSAEETYKTVNGDTGKTDEGADAKKEIDCGGFWSNFSDYYQFTGNFNVTFNINHVRKGSDSFNNPIVVFSTPVDRGGAGYKEFAVVRSDNWADNWSWGNGNKTSSDGHPITLVRNDWGSEAEFTAALKDPITIQKNIIRTGSDFTITDTIISGNKTYTTVKSFTDATAKGPINIFLTGENNSMEIASYSGNIFADAVKDNQNFFYENGVYLLPYDNNIVTQSGNVYKIDTAKIFKNVTGEVTTDTNGKATFKVPGQGDVSVEVVPENPCTSITTPEVENEKIKVSVGETFDLSYILKGAKDGRVTSNPVVTMEDFTESDPNDMVALDDKLRVFFSVDSSHIKLESLTDNNAKDNKTTTINKVIGKEDNTSAYWSEFSDYYPLEGNFDINFDFINYGGTANWNNFLVAIASDADRGAENYKEYAVIRADKYGWPGQLGAANLADTGFNPEGRVIFGEGIFTACDYNFETFAADMKEAKVSMNLKRENNTIIMTAEITPKDSEKTYHYQTTLAYSLADKNSAAAEIKEGNRDANNKNRFTNAITSKVAGKGTLVITSGDIRKTIAYEAVKNTCDKIRIAVENREPVLDKDGTPVIENLYVNQVGSFTVIADGTDPDVKVNGEIKYVLDRNGCTEEDIKVEQVRSENQNGKITNTYSVVSKVVTTAAINFTCGEKSQKVKLTFRSLPTTTPGGTTTPGTTTPGTTTPGTTETPTGPAITTGSAVDPGDANKPGDENKPGDNQPGNTEDPGNNNENPTTPEDPETPTTTKKKKAKVSAVKAAKGAKKVTGTVKLSSGKVVKKATVKVYVNNKKKKTVTTNNKGKFTAKLSKKLKKGDKVKVVITKSTIKKITKTVKVK